MAKRVHIQSLGEAFNEAQNLQQKRDQLQEVRNTVPEEKETLIKNAIPQHSQKNTILFLMALNEMMLISGFPRDVKYSIEEEQVKESVVVVPVLFSFSDISYNLLRRFIENLQRWDRGIRITSMEISTPPDSTLADRGFVQATITIEALFSR